MSNDPRHSCPEAIACPESDSVRTVAGHPPSASRARCLRLGGAALVAVLLGACGGGGGGSEPTPGGVTAPALAIRSEVTGEVRGPFRVEFFFAAPVRFPSGTLPFSLSGARVQAGSFEQTASDTWQVTLVPDANARGLIDLRVPPGAYTDAAGLVSNTTAVEFAQPFDTRAPFARLDFAGPVDAIGRITGPGTFTLRFGAVLDAPLTVGGIDLSAGSLDRFTRTSMAGENDAYTFAYTPPPATRGGFTVEMRAGVVTSGGIPNARNWWTFGLATP